MKLHVGAETDDEIDVKNKETVKKVRDNIQLMKSFFYFQDLFFFIACYYYYFLLI